MSPVARCEIITASQNGHVFFQAGVRVGAVDGSSAGAASIRCAMKSRMVSTTSFGRSIGAVCEAFGISSSSQAGIASAIARERSGGVKPSRPPAMMRTGTAISRLRFADGRIVEYQVMVGPVT